MPKYTASHLIFGSAVHYGAAIYLTTGSDTRAIKAATKDVSEREVDHEYEADYEQNLFRAPILVEEWIRKLGRHYREAYDTIVAEKQITVKVPNTDDFISTMVPDAVLIGEDGTYILELKTSSSSWKLTDLGVRYGDQATQYLWGVQEEYSLKPDGVLPNILYWNTKAYSESNINVFQADIVVRKQKDIEEFKWALSMLVTEIAQKIAAFEAGSFPAPMLFPRNTYYCHAYFRPCEYADICRTNLTMKGRAPHGFIREAKKPTITDPLED